MYCTVHNYIRARAKEKQVLNGQQKINEGRHVWQISMSVHVADYGYGSRMISSLPEDVGEGTTFGGRQVARLGASMEKWPWQCL